MTAIESHDAEILGRTDVNDIEAILGVTNTDVNEITHMVKNNADTLFSWDYSLARPQLRKLYEKAKVGQWNATTDLPWETPVDIEGTIAADQAAIGRGFDMSLYGDTPVKNWEQKEWLEFGVQARKWSLSQFLHGEQGALICTAKIVETVPWYDAKLYASTQVMDEARHVEVFARYLDEKLEGGYQINAHLRALLDDIVTDSRWDMTYLGMQIMVEGLALAAFGYMHQLTGEPLLKKLLRYVMSDEARHVAFGVLSLQEEVWERMGIDPRKIMPVVLNDPTRIFFQQMLFSKIVPNCKKLGLLDRNDSWLRRRFEEIGVIQFEDFEDTGEEYMAFEIGKDITAPA